MVAMSDFQALQAHPEPSQASVELLLEWSKISRFVEQLIFILSISQDQRYPSAAMPLIFRGVVCFACCTSVAPYDVYRVFAEARFAIGRSALAVAI